MFFLSNENNVSNLRRRCNIRTSNQRRRRNNPKSPSQHLHRPLRLHKKMKKRSLNRLQVHVSPSPEASHFSHLGMTMTVMMTRTTTRMTSRLISQPTGLPIRPKMHLLWKSQLVIPTRMTTKMIYGAPQGSRGIQGS